jgi:hypothetical protein
MNCDGIQQLLVKAIAECRVILALDGNLRLEGFQRLDRTLETDRPRVDAVFRRGLGQQILVLKSGRSSVATRTSDVRQFAVGLRHGLRLTYAMTHGWASQVESDTVVPTNSELARRSLDEQVKVQLL